MSPASHFPHRSIAAFAAAVLLLFAPSAHADGSRELTANGGNRPVLEAKNRIDETTGLARDNQLYVYVGAGESLLTASSAVGIAGDVGGTSGDIEYVRPDGTTFRLSSLAACTNAGVPTRGIIADVNEEVAGPSGGDNPNTGTYDACELTVPAGQSGIWGIRFIAPVTTSANYIPVGARDAWTQPNNIGVVLAWDVTVRSAGGTTIPGRTYALYLPFSMGSFLATLNSEVFVATRDGYRYTIDQNGMAPFGFIMFANRRGFTAPGTTDKLYRSVTRAEIAAGSVEFQTPDTPDSGVRVTHKLFIRPPATDLPAAAPIASSLGVGVADGAGGFETWLAPPERTGGGLTSFSFVGADGVEGQLDPDVGGTFDFVSDADGTYLVQVDINGDGTFETDVLAGESAEGTNSIPWDGTDTNGNRIASGQYTFQVTFTPRRGEVHFPFVDAERNVNGTILERTNGPSNPDFVIYWDDTAIAGTASPTGTNSQTGAHTWGNPAATETEAATDFGDQVVIDTWAFVEYSTVFETAAVKVAETDLAVDVARQPDPAGANAPVTYEITVTNNGPDAAPLATLTDAFPPELTGVSWTCAVTNPGDTSIPNLCDENAGTATASGVGDIDQEISLSPGAVLTFTVSARHDGSAGAVTNSASVDPGDASDTVPANNDDTDTFTPVFTADLSLTVAANDPTPPLGGPAGFVVTLTNDGPAVATNVNVIGALSGTLGTSVTLTPSQGTYDLGTATWTVGTLQPGQTVTLGIEGTASETPTTLTAQVSASDQNDTDSTPNNTIAAEDDQDADTLVGQRTDLSVDVSVDNASPPLGTDATFTITLANDGPADASGIDVDALLPAGLTYVSHTAAQGTYDETTGTWDVGDLADGESVTLQIIATETSATGSTFGAEVASASPLDVDSTPGNDVATEDDQDAVTLTPGLPDLELAIAVDDARPPLGTDVAFTVTLDNAGPADATGIDIEALLPPGYTFVSATPAAGAYDELTGAWTGLRLAGGARTTLTIVATATTTDASSFTVEVTAQDQPDADSAPDDGAGDDADAVSVEATPPDLAVAVSASSTTPVLNGTVVFTVDLDNEAAADASGVSVAAALPAGYTFVSASPSQGSYDGSSGNWSVGAVAGNSTAQLVVTATPTVTTPATLTAEVSTMDQPDADSTPGNDVGTEDDQDSVTVQAETIDLELAIAVNDATAPLGTDVTFTLTLDNAGDADATGIDIDALLPAGYTVVSATPDQGSYNATTGVWDVGALASGGQTTLDIVATVASSSPGDVTVEVTAADQPDADSTPGNGVGTEDDQDAIGVTPGLPDLAVGATVSEASPAVGTDVTFTVTLDNDGPAAASGIELAARVPPGYTLVSATPAQGAYDDATGTWTVGGLAAGGQTTLTIVATATTTTASDFAAEVTAQDQPDADSTPNDGAGDDADTVAVQARPTDLALSVSVDDATPDMGEAVTFTVTLDNESTVGASGVDVYAALPAGTTFQSATPSQGSYDDDTGVWTVGSVPGSGQATLTVTALVASATPSTFESQVWTTTEPDLDSTPGNNDAGEDDQDSVAITPQLVDLEVTIVPDDATPALGQDVTFTITLDNVGGATADGVELAALLPAGYTFVSATPAAGSYTVGTGTWTVGTVGPGGQTTLRVFATVTSSTPGAFDTEVAAATPTDVDSTPNDGTGDDAASATVTVQFADIAVDVSADDLAPGAGDPVTFTVEVTNDGNAAATLVETLQTLPPGYTYVSDTPSQGTYDDATGEWTIGGLASGASATLTLVARSGAPGTATFTAESIAQGEPDVDSTPNNNVASEDDQDSVTLTSQAVDLELAIAVDDASPAFGQDVTFTVTLDNQAPASASGIDVAALLPAGYTFVSATPAQGAYTSGTGVWDVGTLGSGGQTTLIVVATANTVDARSLDAEVTAQDQIDADSTPNDGAGDDAATVAVQARPTDLALAISVDDASPALGSDVTFSITLSNESTVGATGIAVTAPLPAGYTFVSADPGVGYNPSTGVWSVSTLAAGTDLTVDLVATAGTTDPATLTAEVTAADQPDVDSTPNNAVAGEDDQASVTLAAEPTDLAVSVAIDDAAPGFGETVTFTVTLDNESGTDATGVALAALLPAGYAFQSATPTQGTYDDATGAWTVGALAAGASSTLTITATAETLDARLLTAEVTAADQPDLDSTPNNAVAGEDDQDTVAVQASPTDLELSIAASDTAPGFGETVTFTVTLDNASTTDATGVAIAAALPAGYTFISATPATGTYDDATGAWTGVDLAGGASSTLTITATANTTDARSMTAQVTAADQPDLDSTPNNSDAAEDDQDTVALQASPIDLAVSVATSDARPPLGTDVTFTVTLDNESGVDATSVELAALLPAGYTFASATPATGAYDDATGVWTGVDLAGGASTTLTIVATANTTDARSLTAEVTAADQPDADSTPGDGAGDDAATVAVQATPPDLALDVAVDNATPAVGETVTFTLTLDNEAAADASGVTVGARLPAGLAFVSATPAIGTYDEATGAWSVGSLAGTGQTTLTIVATVTQPGALALTGEVTALDQPDADSTPNNGVATEDDQDTATLAGQPTDLAIAVRASDTSPAFGDAVTFTVALDNEGAADATGIDVAAALPAGYLFVSATPATGSYNETTGAWTLPSLASGDQTTLTVVATAATLDASTFTAEVDAASPSDADSTPGNGIATEDDQASVALQATPSDLELAITVDDASPDVGRDVTFTLTLDNVGAADATNVDVASLLPPGLTFVSANPAQGTYDEATGTWAVGTLAGGAQTTLQIVATVTSASALAVDAEVTSNDRPDADSTPGNDDPTEDDQDTVGVTPQLIDLAVTATVDDATPDAGTDVTFTFTVDNDGAADATGIELAALLPASYTFVSATPATGSYNGATGLWELGALASGTSTTLTVTATVASPTPGDVTAEVTAADQPDVDSTPGNGDAAEDDQDTVGVTPQLPDLAVSVSTSDATPDLGRAVTLTVTLDNEAAAGATGVELAALVPAGYTLQSATPATGTYDADSGVWTVGSLGGGGSTTLELVVVTDAVASVDFGTEVTAQNETDLDSTPGNDAPAEDDQDAITLVSQGPDLAVGLTVDDASPSPGDDVTFTITLDNESAGEASGVGLSALLPPGYTFVSASSPAYDDATGAWNVGTLAGGGSTTLAIVATAATGQAGTLTAEVVAQNEADADSAPGNNSPGEDDQASVTVTPVAVDLELAMTIDAPAPNVGDVVTLTLTLDNAGGATAPDAQVTGPLTLAELPAGLEYVGATPSTGTYDPDTGIWTVGSFAGGATATLDLQVRVTQAGNYDAIAEVLQAGAPDVDSTPDNAGFSPRAGGGEDDDDYLAFTTAGSSGGGTAGLESDGRLAQTLATVLYARRSAAPAAPERFAVARSTDGQARTSIASPTALRALVPTEGPEASQPVEVSPTDLLPVTNALDIVAVDYLRDRDGRRLGAVFATRTQAGSVYEHTKWVCDRLRGSVLESVEVVDLSVEGRSRPVILVRMRNRDGQLDYAVSYAVYPGSAPSSTDDVRAESPAFVGGTAPAAKASGGGGTASLGSGLVVDSRYLLSEYALPARGDVRNVQMWAVSREYALALARRSLDALDAEGTPVSYRTTTTAPKTPGVFVRQARYERGRFLVEIHNAAGAQTLQVRGGTFSRAETAAYEPFEADVAIPQPEGDDPVVTVEVEVGPVFDAAFFVSTDRSDTADALYLADGPWGSAADPDGATVERFVVEPQAEVPPDDGGRYLERPIQIEGEVTTWATAFRYLHAGAVPVDLSAYRYVELTTAGRAPYDRTVQVRVETEGGGVYGRDIQLPPTPEVQVVWFRDLRDNDGNSLVDDAERAVALSIVAYGNGQDATPFAVSLETVRFGGANGEEPDVTAFELDVPYPNPTSSRATVAFGLPITMPVQAHVFDLLGRRVMTLADGEMSAGRHRLPLDARGLASGVYVVRLRAGEDVRTQRITVVR